MMGRAFIGLGANQGEPDANFRSAGRALAQAGRVARASSLYASAPRDMVDQPDFTNAALELETDLEPADLLLTLKRLELTLGRDPQGVRFGPRVIDLDILVVDGRCVDDPELDLVIPHPRLAERRFALEPLAELDPNLRPWEACGDDRAARTVADLLGKVSDQDVRKVAGPDWINATD
ncbi:MAG: 2-amino-4-hydroxy-6-hydroxymethyldihydropteridine diphosphokinase [Chloroflexota bacterium]|nr:2-amino-4-hydroxy-6-hydroxymethyldihydropteridine diphosphokinase [Chloroflexota bacterium]